VDVADGALSQVTSLLDRAITLATKLRRHPQQHPGGAATRVQSILSEINNIGSTTTYNQEQVSRAIRSPSTPATRRRPARRSTI